ncbi:MAG: PspC domain-containing protein [Chloroflexi bacterium]|nr:PspC domain-containing protein [Chloroflexota bacterium]
MAGHRLTRDLQHSMIGGVCAGFANRYDFDVTLVRVVAVLITVATWGIGVPLYIAAWMVMPRADSPAPAPRPTSDTPDSLRRELREVSDRLAEAARVLAGKTREAAEEISEIARRARTSDAPDSSHRSPAAGGSVTGAIEQRADAAEAAPEASMAETQEMANGRETGGDVDASLSTSNPPAPPPPYTSQSSMPSGMPRAASDQAPNQPPQPPAGPVPPVPPAP